MSDNFQYKSYVIFSTSHNCRHKAFRDDLFADSVKHYYAKALENLVNLYLNIELIDAFKLQLLLNYLNNIANKPLFIPNIISDSIDQGDDPSFLGYYLTGKLSWGVCRPDLRNSEYFQQLFNANSEIDTYMIFISIKKLEKIKIYNYCGYAKVDRLTSHCNVAYNKGFTDFPTDDSIDFIIHANKLLKYVNNEYRFNEWSHEVRDYFSNKKVGKSSRCINFEDTIHENWHERAGFLCDLTSPLNGFANASSKQNILSIGGEFLNSYVIFKDINLLSNPIEVPMDSNFGKMLLFDDCNISPSRDYIKSSSSKDHQNISIRYDNNQKINCYIKNLHNAYHANNKLEPIGAINRNGSYFI